MPEVARSIEIQAPPSAVWRWLSSAEALRRWQKLAELARGTA
jgi:uncharacterized protein YndB with AHSA1/START domain